MRTWTANTQDRSEAMILADEETMFWAPLRLAQFIVDALNEKEARAQITTAEEALALFGNWCQHVPQHEPRDIVAHLTLFNAELIAARPVERADGEESMFFRDASGALQMRALKAYPVSKDPE